MCRFTRSIFSFPKITFVAYTFIIKRQIDSLQKENHHKKFIGKMFTNKFDRQIEKTSLIIIQW